MSTVSDAGGATTDTGLLKSEYSTITSVSPTTLCARRGRYFSSTHRSSLISPMPLSDSCFSTCGRLALSTWSSYLATGTVPA
jgi:hypothetical protein